MEGERPQAMAGPGCWVVDDISSATRPLRGPAAQILGQQEGRTVPSGPGSIFRILLLCAQCELELLCFLKIKWQSWDYLEPTASAADLNNARQHAVKAETDRIAGSCRGQVLRG